MEGVYFWRESDPELGWLSQWYYCPFRDDDEPERIYPTAEQCVMPLFPRNPADQLAT